MSKIQIGVDEAGRGPVLGPMVMAALSFKEEDLKKLEWMGVKDSKLLSREVREDLMVRIKEIVHDFRVEVIEPDAIDLSVMGESNLNWLEAETSARMVGEMKGDMVIVDCPSVNIEAYKTYFASHLPDRMRTRIDLRVEHKADFNYIVVAAASIIAKVTRDRILEHEKNRLNIDFGSGYMSDAKTQAFLAKYHDKYPKLFRRSWESWRRVEIAKRQKKLDDF